MQITFTLNAGYTGATFVAGPYNISGTTSGGTTYELASGITKSQLTTGHTVNTLQETLTGGTIQSTGTCGTSQEWFVGVAPSNTFGFDLWCSEDNATHPQNSAAYQTLSIDANDLPGTPTSDTYIKISGSPNTDYVYRFNQSTGDPADSVTVVQVLGPTEIYCDGFQ